MPPRLHRRPPSTSQSPRSRCGRGRAAGDAHQPLHPGHPLRARLPAPAVDALGHLPRAAPRPASSRAGRHSTPSPDLELPDRGPDRLPQDGGPARRADDQARPVPQLARRSPARKRALDVLARSRTKSRRRHSATSWRSSSRELSQPVDAAVQRASTGGHRRRLARSGPRAVLASTGAGRRGQGPAPAHRAAGQHGPEHDPVRDLGHLALRQHQRVHRPDGVLPRVPADDLRRDRLRARGGQRRALRRDLRRQPEHPHSEDHRRLHVTRRVLVLEWVDGIKINDYARLDAAGIGRLRRGASGPSKPTSISSSRLASSMPTRTRATSSSCRATHPTQPTVAFVDFGMVGAAQSDHQTGSEGTLSRLRGQQSARDGRCAAPPGLHRRGRQSGGHRARRRR